MRGRRLGRKWRKQSIDYDRARIFERDGWRCRYCGHDASGLTRRKRMDALTIDHVIPKCRGGDEEDENLATACHRCNTAKANRTVAEWKQNVARRYCVGVVH